MLWQGIRNDVGATAASEFVLMVEELKDMSATAFLVSFENYFYSKFRWKHRKQQSSDGITLDARDDGGLVTQGLFTVATALGNRGGCGDEASSISASYSIKAMFLMAHSPNHKRPERVILYGDGFPSNYYK